MLIIANTILKKNNKVGELTLPGFKTCSKDTIIKTVWYWSKSGQMDQCNRTDSLETDRPKYNHLIFDKGEKGIQWHKNCLFKKWWWNDLDIHMQKNKNQSKHRPYIFHKN